jgi:hypothetical protein
VEFAEVFGNRSSITKADREISELPEVNAGSYEVAVTKVKG